MIQYLKHCIKRLNNVSLVLLVITLVCFQGLFQSALAEQDHDHETHAHEAKEHQHGANENPHDHQKNEQHEHEGDEEHEHEEQKEQGHQHEHEEGAKEQGHDEHEGHEEEPGLKFSSSELQEFGIKIQPAKSGVISKTLNLFGEVIVAPERLFHVVPRVSGVVREVYKHLGDEVKKDEILASLSSRELADAKAQFVAAQSLLQLGNANLNREYTLFKRKITAKSEYLEAKQAQVEASIKRKAAEQRLKALGLSEQAIKSVLQDVDKDLTLYEIRAPADGIIIEKHAVHGEVLETNTRSFTIADLSQVWVNFTVYQKDLHFVQQGQKVLVTSQFGMPTEEMSTVSTISWISPVLDEMTRSATARVILDNPKGLWRPGLFVSGQVATETIQAEIVVPLSALQTIDGQAVVFIQDDDGDFEPQEVKTGRRDFQNVEILQGLTKGQAYVSKNAFSLKAQMQKGSFGHGHSH